MSIWIRKDIDSDKYKHTIIDGFAAIKTAFGDNFDKRDFFINEVYESELSSMVEDGRFKVTPHILTGVGTDSYRIPSVKYPRYLEIKHPGSSPEDCPINIYIDEILKDYDEYNTLYIISYEKEKSWAIIRHIIDDDDKYVSWDC